MYRQYKARRVDSESGCRPKLLEYDFETFKLSILMCYKVVDYPLEPNNQLRSDLLSKRDYS